jgi:DNA-binding IclR family transcriptional regulator
MYLSTLRSDYLDRVLRHLPLAAHTARTLTTVDTLKQSLAAVRAQGYAMDAEEFMDGMIAIAVPVMNGQGRLTATLSIHAPDQRKSLADLVAMCGPLLTAARALEAMIAE